MFRSDFLHLQQNGLPDLSLPLGGRPSEVDVELPMSAKLPTRVFIAESQER